MSASFTCDEIEGLSHRHHDSEIQIHAALVALGARNAFHKNGDVRLGPLIKLHVRMNRKGIAALQTYTLPIAIGLHTPAVDPKSVCFTNGTTYGCKSGFNQLGSHKAHAVISFYSPYSFWRKIVYDCLTPICNLSSVQPICVCKGRALSLGAWSLDG